MNIIYGVLVIVISFAVAKFAAAKNMDSRRIFFMAAGLECVFVSAVGCLFYFFRLGFFSQLSSQKDVLIRIFGLAIFLAVIVGMKAVNNNKSRLLTPEAEQSE